MKLLETGTEVFEGIFIAIQQFFKEKDVMLENISCASSKFGIYKGFWAVTSCVERVNQSAEYSLYVK